MYGLGIFTFIILALGVVLVAKNIIEGQDVVANSLSFVMNVLMLIYVAFSLGWIL